MYQVRITNNNITIEIHGAAQKLHSGKVVKGINTIDSFSFTILPSNAGFNFINDLKTLITVFNTRTNSYEFRGRVLYSARNMSDSGLIYKEVVCESNLGFLSDTQQTYVDTQNWTVNDLLQHIIDVHNEQVADEDYKLFALGNVTVTDDNDNLYVGIQREDTWKTLNSKLIDKLGGEIQVRVVDGVNYLDYVTRLGATLSTTIELSKNMKSITREDNPLEYVSRLIPLGYKLLDENGEETEERLDISSVNNGLNYIESTEAREAFGIRYATVVWDDVTVASNLLSKGQEYLANKNKVKIKYSITALDLSLIGLDVNDLDIYNYYPIKNSLLGINDVARVIKKNIDIVDEVKSTLEVGDNFKTLSDLQLENEANIKDAIETIEGAKNDLKNYVGNLTEENAGETSKVIAEKYTELINDCENIILTALESYTQTTDFESYKESVSTQFDLLAENLTLSVTKVTETMNEENGKLQEELNKITKYFTFDLDGMTIGEIDNPYKMILDNDAFRMTVNDVDIMWIKDGKVYTPEIEITKTLELFGYKITCDNEIVSCEYGGD